MDNLIEVKISNFVETSFPEFYRTDGPTFVLFLKKYYEWLEGQQEVATAFEKGRVTYNAKSNKVTGKNTFFLEEFTDGDKIGLFYDATETSYDLFTIETVNSDTSITLTEDSLPTMSAVNCLYGQVKIEFNPNYHIRRLPQYDDVDTTTDEFILFFKEKYLKNIQFTTKTNTRQLVKHCLDLYRSKGTPRALDLLFRLVFGVGATTFYPAEDLFKLSDGKWQVPKYLELSLNENTVKFVNKQVVGLKSGAVGFAEAVVRRTVKGRFIDVLYMSAISGNFETGELINTPNSLLPTEDCPVVIGSLSSLTVSEKGTSVDYVVGDVVDVLSSNGEQAKARVTSISDIAGIVDFELVNGGYAYSNAALVKVSEKVLTLNNVTIDTSNNFSFNYFNFFETVIQPTANIEYNTANGTYANTAAVNAYYANAALAGQGYILSTATINATHGSLLISVSNGTINAASIRSGANTTANIASYANVSGQAQVVDYRKEIVLKYSNLSNTQYEVGDTVYQLNSNTLTDLANGVVTKVETDVGANIFITIENTKGIFSTTLPLLSKTSNLSTTLVDVILNLGVANITSDFYSFSGNRIYGNNVNTSANVISISKGFGAGFSISNTYNYTENVTLNTDFLANYANIFLNANAYGFPGNASANVSANLLPTLTYANTQIGKIVKIVGINVGAEYNTPPIVRIYDPLTYPSKRRDLDIFITNPSGVFEIGELVTQASSNARGLVVFANTTIIKAELLRYNPNNFFVPTTNSTSYIVGENSAVQANVSVVYEDIETEYIGLNALVDTSTRSGMGAVTSLAVVDSGFGFYENELISFSKDEKIPGSAFANLGEYGRGTGFYQQSGGTLSGTKKLFDGIYYQDYSYEVRSSITLNKYEEMLKQLLHIPGTKYFGAFVYDSENQITSNISAKIIQE